MGEPMKKPSKPAGLQTAQNHCLCHLPQINKQIAPFLRTLRVTSNHKKKSLKLKSQETSGKDSGGVFYCINLSLWLMMLMVLMMLTVTMMMVMIVMRVTVVVEDFLWSPGTTTACSLIGRLEGRVDWWTIDKLAWLATSKKSFEFILHFLPKL